MAHVNGGWQQYDFLPAGSGEVVSPMYQWSPPPYRQLPNDIPHESRPETPQRPHAARSSRWTWNSQSEQKRTRALRNNSSTFGSSGTHADLAQSRRRLTAKFTLYGLLRWAGSVVLSILYYIAIRLHQDRTLSHGQKAGFDAIIVSISIALGLNIAAGLREVAIHMRLWFLGRRDLHIRQIEVHSLMALAGLLWRSPKRSVKLLCIAWILLNMAVQAGISAISLTFRADPGVADIYLDQNMATVAVPDMKQFAWVGRFTDGASLQSLAAHILGDVGSSYNYSQLPPSHPLTDEPIAKFPYSFWDAGDHWEFAFAKSAPVYDSKNFNYLSVYSNETVKAFSTCRTPPFEYAINATAQTAEIRQTEDNTTVVFPSTSLGQESIYYLTEPILEDPISGSSVKKKGHCGPGCSVVHAIEPPTGPPAEGSTFADPNAYVYYYVCNVTVTPTGEESAGQFNLTSTSAAVAAQAIALSENHSPRLTSSPSGGNTKSVYTSYNFGLRFGEPQNNSASGMASMMSRYAIGVVAAAAQSNPRVLVPGRPPRQGVRLTLDAPVAFAAVLCVASGLQLGFVVLAAWMVRSVDLHDEVVEKLGGE